MERAKSIAFQRDMLRYMRVVMTASPAKINGRDLRSLVPEFPADLLAGFGIDHALVRRQFATGAATGSRRFPAGQRLVAGLRVGMAQPVAYC